MANTAQAAFSGFKSQAARKKQVRPVCDVMRGSFLSVSENMRALEVLDLIRISSLPNDMANVVFISGESGRYRGFVRLSALLRANSGAMLRHLAEGETTYVPLDADQEVAARLLQTRDLPALPVLDNMGRLRGVLSRARIESSERPTEVPDSQISRSALVLSMFACFVAGGLLGMAI